MGKSSKPKPYKPSQAELDLQRRQREELKRQENERLNLIQQGLRQDTAVVRGAGGRQSLLSRGARGFDTSRLRSVLGGSGL